MTAPVKRYHPNHPHIDGRDVVLASDYDRDTQALHERYECNTAIMHARTEALGRMTAERDTLRGQVEAMRGENERLLALINTPHTDEWFEAVRLEAAHQIERWGTSHDAGKAPPDWFWLLGYLGQKAMTAQMAGDDEKARHHTVSSGAMLLNWFRAICGESNAMRPGIDAALQAKQEEKSDAD